MRVTIVEERPFRAAKGLSIEQGFSHCGCLCKKVVPTLSFLPPNRAKLHSAMRVSILRTR
jgi:hypothetical protein